MNPRSGYNLEYNDLNFNYKLRSEYYFIEVLRPMSINQIDLKRKKLREKENRELEQKREERKRRELESFEKERKKKIIEKKKHEKRISINNNKIYLESKYLETSNQYEVSISLKEKFINIVDLATKSGFKLIKTNEFPHKLIINETSDKKRIDYFFKYWQYKIPDLVESENRLPKNIKYINYIDDNSWIKFDYLTFNHLNHSWKFNLGVNPSYTLDKDSNIFSSYVLNRSDFSPYSLSHNNYVLAQFILSKRESEYKNLLEKVESHQDIKNYLFENFNSDDFKSYLIKFNKKWGW